MNAQLPLRFDAYSVKEFISRRARRVRVEVRTADEVRLVIPRWASRGEARQFLHSRHEWILRTLARMRQRVEHAPAPTAFRWDGNDRVLLRGDETSVRVVPATLRRPEIRFDEAITILCPPALFADHVVLRRTFLRALKEEARREAAQLIAIEAPRLGVRIKALRIADQKSLWGSCSASGRISLNWRLLLAPPEVFRYVVIHELAHLIRRDHSARFWSLVARQMPDYEERRSWLRRNGASLHRTLPAD